MKKNKFTRSFSEAASGTSSGTKLPCNRFKGSLIFEKSYNPGEFPAQSKDLVSAFAALSTPTGPVSREDEEAFVNCCQNITHHGCINSSTHSQAQTNIGHAT